jgi:hypothetical protein
MEIITNVIETTMVLKVGQRFYYNYSQWKFIAEVTDAETGMCKIVQVFNGDRSIGDIVYITTNIAHSYWSYMNSYWSYMKGQDKQE